MSEEKPITKLVRFVTCGFLVADTDQVEAHAVINGHDVAGIEKSEAKLYDETLVTRKYDLPSEAQDSDVVKLEFTLRKRGNSG